MLRWLLASLVLANGCAAATAVSDPLPDAGAPDLLAHIGAAPDLAMPAELPAFSTASIEEYPSSNLPSDGDLWASCWADDDNLYAANGDGKGFGDTFADVVVNRISGTPATGLHGVALARGDAVSSIWTPRSNGVDYNRKPTGMVCVDGTLYLAVQDLATDFNDAPAATITRSTDHGVTWTWDRAAPMFAQHAFTTIFFLDYGKNGGGAPDGYVYAYGLDGNWRFSTRVADPTALWLARVPKGAVQDRSQWQFFAGTGAAGAPTWSSDLSQRKPVLHDDTVLYQHPLSSASARDMTVLSQGSVVFDAPLGRYLYTSWTEYTFEFYEAPQPWGPWKKFLSKDFGVYPWLAYKNGGYATTIPSKYISADGKSLYVQSNTFVGGVSNYGFSLRKLTLEPYRATVPENAPAARAIAGGAIVAASLHFGHDAFLDDGVTDQSEDSWNGDTKTLDQWGYTWPQRYNLNAVVYTTGSMFPDGGWFRSFRVQVRRDGIWSDATGLTISPGYPFDATTPAHTAFTLRFDPTWGDGVRIVGTPGGAATFTSIAELAAYDLP